MIQYHFDLYPRDDPRDGTRLVRFTKLQSAEYRGEANGTGAGRFSLRADTTDAGFIDPRGLQYVRVVREDTVAATEVVVGGFFLDSGDFTALDEKGTRLLSFGGAGILSYLSRAIMASHTYLSNDIDAGLGAFDDAMDPFDGTWRLYAQAAGFGGSMLGAMLWRVVYEASHFPSGAYSHRHVDVGDITDSHADDRPANAISDLVLGFSNTLDSDGNAWAVSSGEFKAQVGENVLQVVKRLMEVGLYVEMDPDTFELNAYPAGTHRRDRTGASWGASVIRFQSPTGEDITTGNIKSDAKRAIAAFVKRSWVLAGGDDVYGDATGTTDIPWEGFYFADVNDATAAAGIANVQADARDDAGDTVRLRIRLGTTPASGYYLPFEHILLDDLVTVHTGTGQWDFDEQTFPVAALTVSLRPGGDWDCWVDLGSSYSAAATRQFQVTPVPSHTHPPNPQLCDPAQPGSSPVIEASNGGTTTSANSTSPLTIPSGASDGAIYVFSFEGQGGTDITVTWIPHTTDPGQNQVFTEVARIDHPSYSYESLAIYRLLNPTPTLSGTSVIQNSSAAAQARAWGFVYLTGVNQADPERAISLVTGTGASSAITASPQAGDLVLNAGGFRGIASSPVDPVAGGGQIALFAVSADVASGDLMLGVGHGSNSPTWSFNASYPWAAAAVVLIGGGASQNVLNGTSGNASRCDHQHHWHSTAAPTVNDDETLGYKVGTRWAVLDSLSAPTAITAVYIAADVSDGAAVWLAEPTAAVHIADTTDAHDASAISILDAANDFTATDVEGALAELQSDAEADDAALAAHLSDASDAHDASAISIVDAGSHFTGTDVEAALQELGAGGGGASALDDLTDVTIATPADGQVLTYDSATSEWKNENSASGFSNPMTTAGDIIVGGASGAPGRLPMGSALQHLRVNSGATALEYADPPAGGGSPWTLTVDEDGSSIANWTVVSGTWSTDGTVIKNTSGAATFEFLRYNSLFPTGLVAVELDILFPGANSGTDYAGVRIGASSAGAQGHEIRIRRDTGNVEMELGSGGSTRTFAYGTIAKDTWHTLRVLTSGSTSTAWLNGTLVGSGGQLDSVQMLYFCLLINQATANFRNIRIWTPVLPW